MQANPNNIAYTIGAFIGGAIAGALCGLAPLLVGNSRGQQQLGLIGFISCVVAGLLLGLLLAVPVALVFTIVILTKKPQIPQ